MSNWEFLTYSHHIERAWTTSKFSTAVTHSSKCRADEHLHCGRAFFLKCVVPKLLRTCNCNSELGHCSNSDVLGIISATQSTRSATAVAHGALAKLAKFQLSTLSKLSHCISQHPAAPLLLCRACSASVGQPCGRLACFTMFYQPGFEMLKNLKKVHSWQYCCANFV